MPLKRRFVQVGERRVHYLRDGAGPPAVLIHSSPANAWLLTKEINRLSGSYTVFAPDTPGFGLSDPLPLAKMTVADLADALAETLAAMKMPPCPIFGSHTGAAIALEFGARHPGQVTGLVLDGVPAFTEAECEAYFGDYFRDIPATDLGGQYAEVWTRFRDQSIWFPWSERRPGNLNPYDLGSAHSTHLWASMYFEAQDGYKPAYRAASYYGAGAITAAAALRTPAIYTATVTDMLYPHLSRLPSLQPNQEIRAVGASYEAKRELIAEGFARFGSPSDPPTDASALDCPVGVGRQFIDGADGQQLHFRYAGDPRSPSLLFFHDAPGSSAQWEPLVIALAERWFVVAPDLPGNGESDAFLDANSEVAAYVSQTIALMDRLKLSKTVLYGVGFGSSVALELALVIPHRVSSIALRGLLLADEAQRNELAAAYTPPIEIEPDGAHWYRTWLMLRDSRVWWPWYDRRFVALRRAATNFDAMALHKWTMDVMRRRETYGRLIQAALRYETVDALRELRTPLLRLTDTLVPLSVFDDCLAAERPSAPSLVVEPDPRTHAAALAVLVDDHGA